MTITTADIKALRELTGAGIMDSKRALEEAGGDIKRAQDILREKGIASAAKKSDRETEQGVIESYIHSGGRIGAMVEANCETDFVARTEDFKALAHDIAMQVAAMNPRFIDESEIPDGDDVDPSGILFASAAVYQGSWDDDRRACQGTDRQAGREHPHPPLLPLLLGRIAWYRKDLIIGV